ncbi:hypothetical protein NDA07_19675 [Microcoleus vaginatus DQ-U2]|nr:hypothetical protein [Microcoleus sp. FACHB-DQ6]
MPLKNRADVCRPCDRTADTNLNTAKNLERWFEGIFIPGRSDKRAS